MLNLIVWNKTVSLNGIASSRNILDNETVYLHLNCILMVKWSVWNGTVFDILFVLTQNWII